MSLKIIESLKKAEEDVDVHCIVITGNGKFFCTGKKKFKKKKKKIQKKKKKFK